MHDDSSIVYNASAAGGVLSVGEFLTDGREWI